MINKKSIGVVQEELNKANKSVTVYQPEDQNLLDSKKEITLCLRVYFDGTGGNVENIKKMMTVIEGYCGKAPDMNDYTPEAYERACNKYSGSVNAKDYTMETYERDWKNYNKRREENKGRIKKKMKEESGVAINPTDSSKSYNRAQTNIPKMHKLDTVTKEENTIEENDKKGIKKAVVYVGGVGTTDLKKDDTVAGAGLGSDMYGSGIPSKIKEAMGKLKLELERKDKFNSNKARIEKIEVSVFGFSRGASTARSFTAERQMLADALSETLGVSIPTTAIEYKLVGIYDTVCSVTNLSKLYWQFLAHTFRGDKILRIQQSNVKNYNLAMGANVEKVVHLTAADEYRVFFPLTNIQSSLQAGTGFQLELPGSHCDLGGGDPDFVYEKIVETGRATFIERFIQAGWYDRDDINVSTKRFMIPRSQSTMPTYVEYLQYEVKRTVVAGYSKIPLRIMLHFAEEIAKVKYDSDELNFVLKIQDDLLQKLQQELLSFAISNYGNRDVSAVRLFNDPRFSGLRRKYLHLSATPESGQSDVVAKIKDMARRDSNNNPNRGILQG